MWWTLIDLIEHDIAEFLTEERLKEQVEVTRNFYDLTYRKDFIIDYYYDKMYVVIRWA